jgi:hypothetical protein
MKFNEATYWPKDVKQPYIDYSLRDIEASDMIEAAKWILSELHFAPVLVYCTEEDV